MPDEFTRSPSSRHLCRYFLKGSCRHGERCRYPHTNPDSTETPLSRPSGTGRRGRNSRHQNLSSSETHATSLSEPLLALRHVTHQSWGGIEGANEIEQRIQPTVDEVQNIAIARTAVGAQQLIEEEEPREPPHDRAMQRRAQEEARKADRKRMTAEVARIQAEECAKEEASRKEREELERRALEERNAQAAREQEERARVREQQAREEAARKARAEREEATRRAHAACEEIKRRAKEEQEEAERIARKARLEERRAQEAQVTVQQMVLGSALVTCGAGVDIRSIITGFDLLRVVVKDLPHNSNFNEVATAFTLFGVNPENVVLQETRPKGVLADAIFLMKADQLESIAFNSDHTIYFQSRRFLFEVSPISSEDSMTLSSHNANTLTVYWRVPSTSMIATYPTLDVAKAKAKELDAKVLRGQRVKAFMNTPPPRTPHSWREFNPASVKLINLPLNVPLIEVEVFSGTSLLRVLSSPTYILAEFIEFLREHLEGLPGANRGTFVCLPSKTPNPTSRVEIQFHSWEQARFACDTLNNHKLRNDFPYVHTLIPRAHRYVANISHEQYRSQKNHWDSVVQDKKKGMARVQVHDRPGGRVVITVEGNDKKAVGALKVRVESLFAGERLDPSYWDHFFLSDAGIKLLHEIHAESGAYVRIDKKIPALRVCGAAEAVVRAKESIRYSIGTRSTFTDRVIPLKQRSVPYFVGRGLASLKEIIGEDNVSLDLTSVPRKLTIKVGEDAHHHLQRVIDESLEDSSLDQPEGHMDICPICCDATSHPETLGCGHSYCTSCLWHYLESAANTKKFPLVCMGNNSTCRIPLSIPLIKRFLTVQRFNQLVEVAFLSYLDHHPRELKYCTTPDCNQIYRKDLTKSFLQCPACFSTICSSCQEESHEGMTCLQFKRYGLTAGQEWFTDDWASARGIKKCPGCGVWIEKTEGCNHLTCRCGDHVCWKCMGIFTAETIYAHMHNVHGEIHDEPPQRVLEERRNSQHLAAQQAEREQQERERQRQAALLQQREIQRLRALEQIQADELLAAQQAEREQQERERQRQAALLQQREIQRLRALEQIQAEELLAAQQAERGQQERERQGQAALLQQREIQRLRALEQTQAEEAANRQHQYAEAQRQREEATLRNQEARRREEARRQGEVRQGEELQREEWRRQDRAAQERELQRQQLDRQPEQEEASEGGGCCGLTIAGVLAAIGGLFYKDLI